MKIQLKNLILALKSQLPLKRAFKNFFITGNAWGLFSINSHVNQTSGKEKIAYGSQESAAKAAASMEKKYYKGEFFGLDDLGIIDLYINCCSNPK